MNKDAHSAKKLAWEQWAKSVEGIMCCEPSIVKAGQEQNLVNRPWWAFNAGNNPLHGPLNDEGFEIIKQIANHPNGYLRKGIIKRAQRYLKDNNIKP